MYKKVKSGLIKVAWYLRGQKSHRTSAIAVPTAGYIAPEVTIHFGERVTLGESVFIMPGARLICAGMPPYLEGTGSISIGRGSIVRENAFIQTYGGAITIGSECTINPFCILQGNGDITIGDSVLIAAHAQIFSANHNFSSARSRIRTQGETAKSVWIGSDVWIGASCTILAGVRIHDGVIVAAGSVVTGDLSAYGVYAGVPARLIKTRGVDGTDSVA